MIAKKRTKQQKRPKEKDNVQFAPWLHEALKVLKPPENLTVTEWADKYRILDDKTSAEPGRWRTSRTPYLAGIMNSFIDPDVEEIIFCKPTQVGGTEALNNCLGYAICQNPGPALVVYPTDKLAEYASDNRIQPMIKLSPEMNKHFWENESKLLELQFDGMYVALTGANSPSGLASMPMQYLLEDEIDKYPTNAGREAPPIELAEERSKTYLNRKIMKASTPVFATGPIWRAFQKADCRFYYHMPCPHCGEYQTFKFFPQLKWPKDVKSPEEASVTAYYECESCKGIITDAHKPQMLLAGRWKDEISGKWLEDIKSGKTKCGFHINTIYSPWVTFGQVAKKFLETKDFPDLFQNFINSWLGEPWKQTEMNLSANVVLSRKSEYESGVVPDGTILLTGGVDVQRDCFYYTIRAWGAGLTSWNIAHGVLDTWDDVEKIMSIPYLDKNDRPFHVNLCAIDSGDQTDDVYDFIALNPDWAIPIKGSSRPILQKYRISTIDKDGSRANGMRLYLVDGSQYKDMIAGRVQRPNGKGSWMVASDCDKEYANHICSEEKVKEKSNGQEIYVWKPKSKGIANHYLDCEVYAFLAADLLHVRYLQPEDINYRQVSSKFENADNNSNSTNESGNWIKNKGSWIR